MHRNTHLENMHPAIREAVAENMKERVYSTITLIAVLTVMWHGAGHHTSLGAITTIIGSVVALWLATLISARISYRATHGKPIDLKQYRKAVFTASGLLAPAVTPILIIILGAVTGWYELKSALFASIAVSVLSIFLLSVTAGRKIYDNTWQLLLVSLLETLVGVGVIALKLAIGE